MTTFCDYYNAGHCRSCNLLEWDGPRQIKYKEELLKKELFEHTGIELLATVTSPNMGFRNKVKLVVTGTLKDPILGLWGDEDLDQGRELLNCPVHCPELNNLIQELPEFIRLCQLVPYNISSRRGELKGVIAYHSAESGQSYLRLVLRSKESLDRIKKHREFLQVRFPKLVCITANIQPVPHALLEGTEEIVLTEKDHIVQTLNGVKLRLSPRGFVQTNEYIAKKLYQTASIWCKELKISRFAEIFCGQGAFSFHVAPDVYEAIGFEINPEAVESANQNAKELCISHLTFVCRDANSVADELHRFEPNMVLVNPPRRGLGESLKLFVENPVPYFIYSSCSLKGLAEDLKVLKEIYHLKKAQIFDMFPHTEHFETLVLLERKK